MAQSRTSGLWLSLDPVHSSASPNGSTPYVFSDPFTDADWSDVQSNVTGLKIFSSSIYKLSASGYTVDPSYVGYAYPTQSKDVLSLLRSLANLGAPVAPGAPNTSPLYMESPVLPAATLPDGASYNSYIESCDPSFNGIFGYLHNSFSYDVSQSLTSVDEVKTISIKYVAMDEPLFFAHIYQTPPNHVVNGVRTEAPQWSTAKVAELAVNALVTAKATLGEFDGGLTFGDIEPIPYCSAAEVKTWVEAYHDAAVAHGLPTYAQNLAFFQADVVWGVAGWQTTLEEVSAVLEAKGVPLNVIIDGYNNETSPALWSSHALEYLIKIYLDPKINYQSIDVQNWDTNAPTPVFDSQKSANTTGTISNTGRYVSLIDKVYSGYTSAYQHTMVTESELYYSIQMLATQAISFDQFRADLAIVTPLATALTAYVQSAAPMPGAADLLASSSAVHAVGGSPVNDAMTLVPAGMTLAQQSWFLVPGGSAESVSLAGMSNSGSIGSLYLYGSASGESPRAVSLPDGVVTVVNVLPSGASSTGSASFTGGKIADFVYLASGSNVYTIGNKLETVVDATGTANTAIRATATNAGATVIGAADTIATMEILTGGTITQSAASRNVRLILDAPSAITLNGDSTTVVVVPQSNNGRNTVTLGSSGQSVAIKNGQPAVINSTSTYLTPSSSTTIDGGGNGQLNVYSGGIVSLGANIVGVTAVSLYRTTAQSAYRLELSSTQQNLVVNDVAGGSTVWIKNSSQAVINRGSNVTVAKATADNANAVVRGNASANATLEVTTGGSISLASADNYLTVCLDIPAKLQLNAMQFITADASVGHSTITTVAAKQTVLAGPGDKIFDSMRAGMTLIGDIAHLNGDLIAGYNSRDVVHITDLPYEGTKLSITKGFGRADLTLSHGGTQLHLSVSSMGYSGPGSAFELSSDGGTGSLLTFADPARSIKI